MYKDVQPFIKPKEKKKTQKKTQKKNRWQIWTDKSHKKY